MRLSIATVSRLGALLLTCVLGACNSSSSTPASDGGVDSGYLPAEMCAPECTAPPEPLPPGYDRETTCYDGCNWCHCSADGPIDCTARACFDAGL